MGLYSDTQKKRASVCGRHAGPVCTGNIHNAGLREINTGDTTYHRRTTVRLLHPCAAGYSPRSSSSVLCTWNQDVCMIRLCSVCVQATQLCLFSHVKPSCPNTIDCCRVQDLKPDTVTRCSLKRPAAGVSLARPPLPPVLPPWRLISKQCRNAAPPCHVILRRRKRQKIQGGVGPADHGRASLLLSLSLSTLYRQSITLALHQGCSLAGLNMITPCAAPGCEELSSQRCSSCK